MEKHGATETDVSCARSYDLALCETKKQSVAEKHANGNSVNAEAYASATQRMAEVPLAELGVCLRAWRCKCPWLNICKSVSMITR